MASKPSNKIFITNIPFDQTEEQLTDIFSEVGPVESFRLVFDKENGRPKGIAYCTYRDIETAASAKRNLNGYTVNGRSLRVEFADGDSDLMSSNAPGMQHDLGLTTGLGGQGFSNSGAGTASHGGPSMDAIRGIIQRLSPEAMLRILQTVKDLQAQNPAQAKVVLEKSPSLMYGMLHILVQLGLITPDMIAASLQSQAPSSQSVPAQPQGAPPLTNQMHGHAQLVALASQLPILANCLNLPPAQGKQSLSIRAQSCMRHFARSFVHVYLSSIFAR